MVEQDGRHVPSLNTLLRQPRICLLLIGDNLSGWVSMDGYSHGLPPAHGNGRDRPQNLLLGKLLYTIVQCYKLLSYQNYSLHPESI